MWFKNLRVYRLSQPIIADEETLQQQLGEHSFKPCGPQEIARGGWIAPNPAADDMLCHISQGMIALAMRQQERLLPRAVVKEELEKKVRALETAEARRIYRKEKKAMEDEIMFELMPRAFTRSRTYRLFISNEEGLIYIDASSDSRAEMMLSLLRESIGSLQVTPIAGKYDARNLLTSWLASGNCAPFELGEECELYDNANEKAKVKLKNHELSGDDVDMLLKNARSVSQLAIRLPGRVSAIVHQDMSLKRLSYGDVIEQQLHDGNQDDAGAEYDAQFTLMALELRGFVNVLLEQGGVQETQKAA
jgi:recombination associated protein RdgC